MKKVSMAILGATGAVGRQMLRSLEERNVELSELRLLASVKSAGTELGFRGRPIRVEVAREGAFDGCDIVLGAVQAPLARVFAEEIKRAGAVFIDNSSAFRLDDSVPLVVPEINAQDAFGHHGIIASPNCSTTITLVAVNAVNKLSHIKAMYVSTYQAVSGAGAMGVGELERETRAIVNGENVAPEVFAYQIAENLIPQIGGFCDDGFTSEELKMQNEGRKIMHSDSLLVNCTCVRVPVMRSHSISVTVITDEPVSPFDVRMAINRAPGCVLTDDPSKREYPMPLQASNKDAVYVGRIRPDPVNPNGLTLWCSGDQLRKGAATNTVQIAELLINNV